MNLFKILLAIISVQIFSFSAFSQINELVLEDSIVLITETGNISGSLTKPDDIEASTLVLIIAGSGPTDRNGNNPMMKNNSLKMLSESLASNGIASIRYDKRGVASSMGAAPSEFDLRFESYINDAVDWVNFIRKNTSFKKIIVAGHSEGSLIGMITAHMAQADGFISIAGAGESADKVLKRQMKAQPPFVKDYALPRIDSLKEGLMLHNVDPMFNTLFRPSVQPYLISWFKYDPKEEIGKLRCPVLIIQGSSDIQVSIEDAEMLSGANKEAEIEIITDMNHILKNSVADRQENILTYNNPVLPLDIKFVEIIVKFIQKI